MDSRLKLLFLSTLFLTNYLWAGEINLFLFRGSGVAKNIKVELDNNVYFSDEDGLVYIEASPGKRDLKIYNKKEEFQSISVNVDHDRPLFINFTLLDNQDSKVEIQVTKQTKSKKKEFNNEVLVPLEGRIKDSINGKTVKGKTKVIVHGIEEVFYVLDGKLSLLKLPAGSYDISFIHKGYSTKTVKEIYLNKNQIKEISIDLKPSGLELEEFVVLAPNSKSSVSALLEVRRGLKSVADLIGAEQISKSGDSDAGSSLRRVTGLSLVDGKYVYIRGLGERYSNTLLNSLMLASPDPSRRVVPLDLFPSSVIENMKVQKGYSADMPGEFAGGVIEIKTRSIPDKAYSKFNYGQSFSDLSGALTYEGTSEDWTTFSGRERDMPNTLKKYLSKGKNISALTSDERKKLGRSIRKNYQVKTVDSNQITPSFSISGGESHRIERYKIGYNIGALYGNSWSIDSESRTQFNHSGSSLVEDSNADVFKTKNNLKLGSIASLGLNYKKNKFEYHGALLRNASSVTRETSGTNSEKEKFIRTELTWQERELLSHQVSGEHEISRKHKVKVNWNLGTNTAILLEPDNKMYTYKKIDGNYQLEKENGSSSNTISWNEMTDQMENYRLDIGKEFQLKEGIQGDINLGHNLMHRKRDYTSRNFYFVFNDSENKNEKKKENPDDVFNDPNAELYQQANETDNYKATQIIRGTYITANTNSKSLDISLGVRYEESTATAESFKLFNQGKTISELKTYDYLPSFFVTYKITDKMQLRGNLSETISRPDLREISNTVWNDNDQGAKYRGNPNLSSAEIENVGIRWEWFYNRGELISLGAFQKKFTRPIEEIYGSLDENGNIVNTTDTQYTFINIDEATNQGLEFEFRKKLTDYFTFGGNYSVIDSSVKISKERAGQLTSLERPLQGQSPNLLNLQLDYEFNKRRSTWTLLYNSIGRRITGVGADGRPDEYQEELASLDSVISFKLGKDWNLKMKVKNILDPEIERTQGDKVTRTYRSGQTYSFGLSGRF